MKISNGTTKWALITAAFFLPPWSILAQGNIDNLRLAAGSWPSNESLIRWGALAHTENEPVGDLEERKPLADFIRRFPWVPEHPGGFIGLLMNPGPRDFGEKGVVAARSFDKLTQAQALQIYTFPRPSHTGRPFSVHYRFYFQTKSAALAVPQDRYGCVEIELVFNSIGSEIDLPDRQRPPYVRVATGYAVSYLKPEDETFAKSAIMKIAQAVSEEATRRALNLNFNFNMISAPDHWSLIALPEDWTLSSQHYALYLPFEGLHLVIDALDTLGLFEEDNPPRLSPQFDAIGWTTKGPVN